VGSGVSPKQLLLLASTHQCREYGVCSGTRGAVQTPSAGLGGQTPGVGEGLGLWVTPLSPAAAGRWPGEGVTLFVPILVLPGCCCWDPPGCCCQDPRDAAAGTPRMLFPAPQNAAAGALGCCCQTPGIMLPGPPGNVVPGPLGCCYRDPQNAATGTPRMLLPDPRDAAAGALGCCCQTPGIMLPGPPGNVVPGPLGCCYRDPQDAATRSPGCCCRTPGMLLLEPWDAATGTPTMLFPDPLGCCYQDRGMLLPGPLGCCCQPPGMLLPDPRGRGRLWRGAGQAGGAPPLPLPPAAALPWELPGVGVLGFFPSAETRRVRLVVTLRGCSPSLPVTAVEQERAARVCTVTL